MEFHRTRKKIQDINLTALIDIVFHLMIFVMLTTTFVVSESIELSLPSSQKAGSSSAASDTKIMRIHVAPGERLWVDNRPITSEDLTSLLAERLALNPDYSIAIFTMPGVTVQQLVKIMDMVYLTGGRNVQVDKGA